MPDRFNHFAQSFLYPRGLSAIAMIVGLVCLEIACGAFVYVMGGTNFSYLHAFYVPIILAGMVFRMPGGFLAGFLGGMIVGPYMPADVFLHAHQPLASWVLRSFFFCFMGVFSGALSDIFRLYLKNLHLHITTDLITKLPNMAGLKLIWQDQTQQSHGHHHPSVLLIVLNRLREIDKAFGSEATTELLKEVTRRLGELVPLYVKLAYVDYGTFAIVIPHKTVSAVEIREKCRQGLGNRFLIDRIPVFLESHFGDATPQETEDIFSIVRKAKIAVDKSIELSQQSASFEEKDDQQIQRNLKLSHDLSQAIEENQLKLVYQPKLDLKTKSCTGFEALVRWVHPELGMISPGEFIPMIEKTLLINQFTKWLLKTSLSHLQQWFKQGLHLTCALNFSMKNFEDPEIFTDLRTFLKEYEIHSGYLEIEVTETAIATNLEKVADILQSCREEGIKISVDDFGTGQSSMKYLFKLPVDCIKIDQTFIRSMITNSAAEAIVRSAITLGHELNLEVIAEGVETEEEYLKLNDLNCDGGQGFYFARPMPFEMATSWLQSRTVKLKENKAII